MEWTLVCVGRKMFFQLGGCVHVGASTSDPMRYCLAKVSYVVWPFTSRGVLDIFLSCFTNSCLLGVD